MFGIYNTNKLFFAKINGQYARNIFYTLVEPKDASYSYGDYLYKDIFSKYYYYTKDKIGELYLESIASLANELPRKYMTTNELNKWLEENKKYYAS